MDSRKIAVICAALCAAPSMGFAAGWAAPGRGENISIQPGSLARPSAAQRLAEFMSSDRPDVDMISDLPRLIAAGALDDAALAPVRQAWARIDAIEGDPRSHLSSAEQLQLGVIHYLASHGVLPAQKLGIDRKTAEILPNMWAIAAMLDGKKEAQADPAADVSVAELDQAFKAGAEALAKLAQTRKEKPFATVEAEIPGVFEITLTPKMGTEWRPRPTRTAGERALQAWNGSRFSESVEVAEAYWVAINGFQVAFIDAKKDQGRTMAVARTVETMIQRGGRPVTVKFKSSRHYRDALDEVSLEIVGFAK